MRYAKEFSLAKKVALEVGRFLKSQTIKKIDSEEGRDIKLELDKISENTIIHTLLKEFSYNILSEEIGFIKEFKKEEPYWIIDPIDGTLNYSRNNPSSCISIALWIDKKPIFGVIYDFNRDEIFSGYSEVGAWLDDTPLQKQCKREKSQAILSTGISTYMNNNERNLKDFILQIQEYKKIRIIGSAALSLAYVACGRFDAYLENNIKLWDIAAGIAINNAIGNIYKVYYLDNFETNTRVGNI